MCPFLTTSNPFAVLDAIGKPKSGLMEAALYWPGNFHECVNIQSPATEDSVKGNYCLLKIPLPMALLKGLSDAGKDQGEVQTNGIAAAVRIFCRVSSVHANTRLSSVYTELYNTLPGLFQYREKI